MRRSRRDDLLGRLRARVELEDRLRRALDVVSSEDEALRVVAEALEGVLPGRVSVHLVDATGRRLGDSLVRSGEPLDAGSCVALRRHGTTETRSSAAFDACAHLRSSPEPVSGVCVPVACHGHTSGVLQWEGEVSALLHPDTIGAIEAVAALLALHLAVLRAGDSIDDLRTDPLTGLLNRHSTGIAIRNLVRDLVPFSLALCDIDDFARFNDVHGHDAGDRALRLFAQTLTSTLRPNDVVGRTGGDIFAVAFPGTSAIDAAHALERVREVLVLSLSIGDLPAFTVSCGVSDSNQGSSIEAIIETAELAVALAKRSGANRVVIAGEETTHLPGDAGGSAS